MWKRFLLADVCLAPVIAIVSDIDLRLRPTKSPTQARLYAEIYMGAGVGLVSGVTVLA